MGTRRTLNGGGGRFDDLPEELWPHIFYRVPHVTRLQSRSVCQHWKRVLSELEAAKPVRSPRCLALEKLVEDQDGMCDWSMVNVFAEENTAIKVSFPPGWIPGVHGGIRGGGRSGLVAFWHRKEHLYWVGSPVHDKWEKIPEPCSYNHLRFKRRGFQLLGEENSGFYKIVQFQWNGLRRQRSQARSRPNFVIQVYSSRARAWKTEEKTADPVLFLRLHHSCVCGNRVYFLGTVKPPPDQEKIFKTLGQGPQLFPTAIWALDADSGVFSEVISPRKLDFVVDGRFQEYWSSLQLHVLGPADFKISVVVEPDIGPSRRMYVFGLDQHRNWVLERDFALDDLTNFQSDLGEDWGLGFLAYDANEALFETQPELATDFYSVVSIWSFDKEQKKWGQDTIGMPPYQRDGGLPIIQFTPCECLKDHSNVF